MLAQIEIQHVNNYIEYQRAYIAKEIILFILTFVQYLSFIFEVSYNELYNNTIIQWFENVSCEILSIYYY